MSIEEVKKAFLCALPIVLGYVSIGVPCGILSASIGLDPLQVFILSLLFYSGAGQFMIPNMWLAGASLVPIIASVSLVNTRQMLYGASFAPYFQKANKYLSLAFAATVTDESYGVSIEKFKEDPSWTCSQAYLVNVFSHSSWTLSNVAGVFLGHALSIPLAIAAFAMTSIFICLLVSQKITGANIVAVVIAMLAVFTCKSIGLTGPAILIGALVGVMAAYLFTWMRER